VKPDEIILVLDPLPELIDFYKSRLPEGVKIAVSRKFGLSNARNMGAKNAIGEIVAFIDDDAMADERWLENLVRNYEDPSVVCVGGFIKPFWENGFPKWFPEELYWIVGCSYKGLPGRRARVRNPIGCNMSFARSVFGKVGYFRSDMGRFGKTLLASEETELSIRISEKIPNSKIVYEPLAVVSHAVNRKRATLQYVWKRSFFEGISKAIMSSGSKSSTKLSAEGTYLKYLFRHAIPSRLSKIYKLDDLSQLAVLLFSITAVSAGFSIYRLFQR
jgi:glycosyltransferase involved in cell wall biosynthesis